MYESTAVNQRIMGYSSLETISVHLTVYEKQMPHILLSESEVTLVAVVETSVYWKQVR